MRTILHVDMDAFYAAVEQLDEPRLRGFPVLVGGSARRGVVAAASYEARTFGIHSAMPMGEALKRCPDAVVLRPRMDRYREISARLFSLLRQMTPVVEGLSLDEAFLDISNTRQICGSVLDTARALKHRIADELRLPASIGVGPNKLVAKIASDLDKPDGLRVIAPDEVQAALDPLPVERLPGIGPRALGQLRARRIRRIGELRLAGEAELRPLFGRHWMLVRQRAAGCDEREVRSATIRRSVSSEQTFDTDLSDPEALEGVLARLSDKTASRLREKGFVTGVVVLKIRDCRYRTCTRQRRLAPATASSEAIRKTARALLGDWRRQHPGIPLRLLGVGAADLSPAGQLPLFDTDAPAHDERVDSAVDRVRARFGPAALVTGRSLR